MNKTDGSPAGTNLDGIPSKPRGTVYFHQNRQFKPTRLKELQLPLGKNIDVLDVLIDENCLVHLINCNENESRNFISALLELLKRLMDEDELKYQKFRYRKHQVFFYFCALDRDCFYLLSKIPRCHYEIRLAYGTRIVSFRDSQDLIDCFTTLKLRKVTQDCFPPEPSDIQSLLKGKDVDTKWMDASYGVDICPESRASKAKAAKNKDGKSQKIEIYAANVAELLQRCIELRFDNSATQFDNSIQVSHVLSSVCTDASQTQRSSFQVGIGKHKTHLCSFLAIALQMPTLTELKSFGGFAEATSNEIVNALKDRPAASASCSPLEIVVGHPPEHHSTINYFWATYKLLDVFHEKKLLSMYLCVNDEVDHRLMEAAVASILKSAYIRKLEIFVSYPNDDTIPEVCDFLFDLTQLCPRLPRGFYVDVKFSDELGWFDPLWRREINRSISRFDHTIDEMNSRELCILTDFVSTKVVASRRQSPIRVLPVDIFRRLREFLTSGPSPYSEDDFEDSDESDESEGELNYFYGYAEDAYNDDEEDDEDDDYYEW